MYNKSMHVLLVEDVKIAQVMAKKLLENIGCTVALAETGEQAVIMANQQEYDYIFMDIGLPDMDGFQVTKMIKERSEKNCSTRIIALTANIAGSITQQCFDVGISEVLSKPITTEECERLFRQD